MDTYPRCATCKHFTTATDRTFPHGIAVCLLISRPDNDGASIEIMGNGWCEGNAVVHVRPDFGCVLHEPKE